MDRSGLFPSTVYMGFCSVLRPLLLQLGVWLGFWSRVRLRFFLGFYCRGHLLALVARVGLGRMAPLEPLLAQPPLQYQSLHQHRTARPCQSAMGVSAPRRDKTGTQTEYLQSEREYWPEGSTHGNSGTWQGCERTGGNAARTGPERYARGEAGPGFKGHPGQDGTAI